MSGPNTPVGGYITDLFTAEQADKNLGGDSSIDADNEHFYANKWATEQPESYLPSCRAALGPS